MSIQVLYRSQAFSTGAKLWVIPDELNSSLMKKLDWYLNFQLTRANFHKSQSLHPQIKSIINENEMPSFDFSVSEESPLMISAENSLPTKYILQIKNKSSQKAWLNEIFNNWRALGQPELRVFLPDDISNEDFQEFWSKEASSGVSVVPISSRPS